VTYHPVADFSPIAIAATMPLAITVSSNSPVKSIGELIAAAKAASGKLEYGSTGIGSVTHVAGELFKSMT
jgi:tripartite-type tricarboxylate transporter receptor subunit TctC